MVATGTRASWRLQRGSGQASDVKTKVSAHHEQGLAQNTHPNLVGTINGAISGGLDAIFPGARCMLLRRGGTCSHQSRIATASMIMLDASMALGASPCRLSTSPSPFCSLRFWANDGTAVLDLAQWRRRRRGRRGRFFVGAHCKKPRAGKCCRSITHETTAGVVATLSRINETTRGSAKTSIFFAL